MFIKKITVILVLLLFSSAAWASYKDFEEAGQIGATIVSGNAADDQVLVGAGSNTMSYKSLPTCSTATTSKLLFNNSTTAFSCGTDLDSAGELFTDNGYLTYLTSTTDDFAIGGTSQTAAFSVDESANTVRIGNGSGSNADLIFYNQLFSSNIQYTTNDSFNIANATLVGIGLSTLSSPFGVYSFPGTQIRIRGDTEAVEIAEIKEGVTTGALDLSTVSGTGTGAWIEFRSENATKGVVIRDSSGAGTTVFANLYVVDDASDDYLNIRVNNDVNGEAGLNVTANQMVSIGTTANSYYNKFYVNGGIRMSSINVDTTQTDGMDMDTFGAIGYDMAESMWVEADVDEGDLVSVTDQGIILRKSKGAYDSSLIGIVSSHKTTRAIPVLQMGSPEDSKEMFPDRTYKFISLAGQVEVKVNLENGPIEIGDWITSSSTPGVGMKATGRGTVVGKAMEPFKGTKKGKKEGKILVFGSLHDYLSQSQNQAIERLKVQNKELKKKIKQLMNENDYEDQLLKDMWPR